jgi:hypothetical protein
MKKTEKNIVQSKTLERLKRKSVHFPITLIADDNTFSGFITNLSSSGVSMYVDITFHKELINFNKESTLSLEFQSPVGELISLNCRVKWLRVQELAPQSLMTSMGMEIIAPPSNFLSLIRRL